MRFNIRLENIGFGYGEKVLFRNVNFSISEGEAFVLTGKSGCGKSTLFDICAGLIAPHEGFVYWNDSKLCDLSHTEIIALRRRMGVVFQQHGLISNMSVFENIALPLRYHTTISDSDIKKMINEHLEKFYITEFKTSLPETLSIGQARLVAIARALIMKPDFIFLDEPISGLDPVTAKTVMNIIRHLCEEAKLSIFIASNILSFIKSLNCPIIYLNNGRISLHRDIDFQNKGTEKSEFLSYINGES